MRDFIVTDITFEDKVFEAAALYEGYRLMDLRVTEKNSKEEIGAICLGHLIERKQKKGVAFMRVGETDLYVDDLPDDFEEPVLLQITKEAQNKKLTSATTRLRLPGEFLVLCPHETGVSFSAKLDRARRNELRAIVPAWHNEIGLLFRTNAEHATDAQILAEAEALKDAYFEIKKQAKTKQSGTYLYRPQRFYLEMLRDLYLSPDRVFCDSLAKANALLPMSEKEKAEDLLYEAKSLSLAECYRLPSELKRLLDRKVWLKSGAYMFIERTEACTVIDVNSGRNQSGKKSNPLAINKEAACECIRQMRLRNLSGMILIDFISMHDKQDQQELLSFVRSLCHAEQNPSDAIDMTGLGLMELTRKRTRPTLAETLFRRS